MPLAQPSFPNSILSVADAGFDDYSLKLFFGADTDAADWASTWFELFISGAWQGADDIENFSSSVLVATNSGGPWPSTIPAGTPWRLVAAPTGVLLPESGLTV